MCHHLFQRIVDTIQAFDPLLLQWVDPTGSFGISIMQKIFAAIRILTYGLPVDAVDECVGIGESTITYD
jgi:hypothetical protein